MQAHIPVSYEQPIYSDLAFPLVFHLDRMDMARHAVYTNWHVGIELLYCIEGAGQLICGAEATDFAQGDLVVIDSNSIHTLHLKEAPCRYYCMIVEPGFLQQHGLPVGEAKFKPLVRCADTVGIFQQIIRIFQAMEPYYKPQVLSCVLALFVNLLRAHVREESETRSTIEQSKSRRMMLEALAFIRAHLNEPLTVEQISSHVGMSKYYFCRQFQAYTGMSVLRHINALKCDFARKLIVENGFNVSEAAHYLGFQHLSYFSKLYKKHIGVLPSTEIKMKRGDKRGEVFGTLKGIHE